MFVVVQHRIKDPEAMFSRGENLVEDAPPGVRARQFYPSVDLSEATCLWDAPTVAAVKEYIEETLGDSSENSYFEVSTEQALGLPEPAVQGARR